MARKDGYSRLDLAADVAKETTGLSNEQARGVVDKTIECIAKALKRGDDVCLQNFGTLKIKRLPARDLSHLKRTGSDRTKLSVPARNTVSFKPAPTLKTVVNERP